ncbi:MaoC family dehydratase N-terminal domain-containing protein [Streptomyces shenzhenensis]|uniref:FAS1-like dehydratase domain-containing protein n=1 Tax=Streptomyces shenzhenensis TaxID=943815 RepID=UPI0033EAD383
MAERIVRSELLLPGPARALAGLLGVPVPDLADGSPLPALWHWVYLLDRPAESDLGTDGHPVRHTLPAPPAAGQRRMWAGGRVRFHGSLTLGNTAAKESSVLSVTEKQGRSGPLTFVTVGHRIEQDGRTVIEEEQDIVYRPAAPGSPTMQEDAPQAQLAEPGDWHIDVTPTLLFRFSALTYNAHRIHYDRDYARNVEGYPGLLVHGPLQVVAMAEAVRALGHTHTTAIDYRLLAPLFDHQGMVVTATPDGAQTTALVKDRHGRRTATASLRSDR